MINVVFACDDNYAQHAGVAIASLKEQHRSGMPVVVHVLDGGISAANLERFDQLKDDHLNIIIYKGNIEQYSKYLVATYFSIAAYLRLSVETILPENITRIIYCDCDIIFLKPLDELWNMDLRGNLLAAVEEGWNKGPNLWRKDLGIDEPGRYFNSGVMLIDLKAWRAQHICERVNDYLRSNWDKVLFWDQDGLNAVLYKQYLPIEKTWNFFSCTIGRKKTVIPHIVHFASEFKPWFYACMDPFQDDYLNYLRLSPWRDYQFPDKNYFNRIKKMVLLNTPEWLINGVTFFTFGWRQFMGYLARQIALIKIKTKQ